MNDQVHPDHTLRLADRLIAADKDFELLIVPGAEHTFIDCMAYVRKRCWDFLVRELMGVPLPAYRPARIAIDPEVLGEPIAGAAEPATAPVMAEAVRLIRAPGHAP